MILLKEPSAYKERVYEIQQGVQPQDSQGAKRIREIAYAAAYAFDIYGNSTYAPLSMDYARGNKALGYMLAVGFTATYGIGNATLLHPHIVNALAPKTDAEKTMLQGALSSGEYNACLVAAVIGALFRQVPFAYLSYFANDKQLAYMFIGWLTNIGLPGVAVFNITKNYLSNKNPEYRAKAVLAEGIRTQLCEAIKANQEHLLKLAKENKAKDYITNFNSKASGGELISFILSNSGTENTTLVSQRNENGASKVAAVIGTLLSAGLTSFIWYGGRDGWLKLLGDPDGDKMETNGAADTLSTIGSLFTGYFMTKRLVKVVDDAIDFCRQPLENLKKGFNASLYPVTDLTVKVISTALSAFSFGFPLQVIREKGNAYIEYPFKILAAPAYALWGNYLLNECREKNLPKVMYKFDHYNVVTEVYLKLEKIKEATMNASPLELVGSEQGQPSTSA